MKRFVLSFMLLSGLWIIPFSHGVEGRVIRPEWWGASPSASAFINTTAIQKAIMFDKGRGIPIELGNGTFMLQQAGVSAWAVELKENTILQGQGSNGTTLRMSDGQGNFVRLLSTDSADADGVNNVQVRGLRLDGNEINQPACAEQCHCLFLSGVLNATVENTELTHCKGDGIYIHAGAVGGSYNVRVHHNVIHDVTRVGINFDGANSSIASGNSILNIVDNWAFKMEADAGGTARRGNVFTGNVIRHVNSGISLTGLGVYTPYVDMIIQGNVIEGDGSPGYGQCINLRAVEGAIVTSNTCREFTGAGIQLESGVFDSVIADNIIHAPGLSGISLGGGTLPCIRRVTVQSNIVRNGGEDGIRITNCTYDAPGEITIIGNIVTGHASAGFAGIALLSGDRIAVLGNAMRDNNRGVRIGGSHLAMISPSIVGNSFGGNTLAGISFDDLNSGLVFTGNNLTMEHTPFLSYPNTGSDVQIGLNGGYPR